MKSISRGRDLLVAIAILPPAFLLATWASTPENGLLVATVVGAIWVAVSERWQARTRRGFWFVVGAFGLGNALLIALLPGVARFQPALAAAIPLAIAEGLLLMWLLGRLPPD